MKVGILTFHAQLNYGGVLQCWALKEALRRMGHTVVVVDRWLSETNSALKAPFVVWSVRQWVGCIARGMAGCRTWDRVVRHLRTMRFVRRLGLTPYHFCEWQDAPKDLGVDCLVVGSDQVWHGGDWGRPEPYLLFGAPSVRAISYAASFGMRTLPETHDYATGFRRFAAISVREAEGVELVRQTGYAGEVAHVVDPSLLLPREVWWRLAKRKRRPRRLVCYFLSEDIPSVVRTLEPWAKQTGWTVEILCDGYSKVFPRNVRSLVARVGEMVKPSRVRISLAAGPREFVRAFSRAEACVTDSFHAVMFSSIYNCNVRFLRPTHPQRKLMFTRIEGFAQTAVEGEMMADNLASALESIARGTPISFRRDVIDSWRNASWHWLEAALRKNRAEAPCVEVGVGETVTDC